jgi:hypothetical protein
MFWEYKEECSHDAMDAVGVVLGYAYGAGYIHFGKQEPLKIENHLQAR